MHVCMHVLVAGWLDVYMRTVFACAVFGAGLWGTCLHMYVNVCVCVCVCVFGWAGG